MWDTISAGDVNHLYHSAKSDLESEVEDSEELEESDDQENLPKDDSQRKKLRKTISFFTKKHRIDFVEADKDFVVAAGQDHVISVWHISTRKVFRRLVGHYGPIRGLNLQDVTNKTELPDKIIISASEDGTIRQWSLQKGEAVKTIETNHHITCMGVMLYESFVAIGIDNGYLEVQNLLKEKVHTQVKAHDDPIDALVVEDFRICTAVYDKPCSLKVWELKNGKLNCIYILEEMHEVEILAFGIMRGNILLLGDAKMPRLHLVRLEEKKKHCVLLGETAGHIESIKVVHDVVLISTVTIDGKVELHMYLQVGFEHLITFTCKGITAVTSTTVVRYETTLKFILGGAGLAVLKVDDTEKYDNLEVGINRYNFTQRYPHEGNERNEKTALNEEGSENVIDKDGNLLNELKNIPKLATFKISNETNQPVGKENHTSMNVQDTTLHGLRTNKITNCPNRGRIRKLPPMSNIKEYSSMQNNSENIGIVRQQNIDNIKFWSSNPNVLSKFTKSNLLKPLSSEMTYREPNGILEQLEKSMADETVEGIDQKIEMPCNEKNDSQKNISEERNEESSSQSTTYQEDKPSVKNDLTQGDLPRQKPHSASLREEYIAENIRMIAKEKNNDAGKKTSIFSLGKKKKQQKDSKKAEPKRKRKCCIM